MATTPEQVPQAAIDRLLKAWRGEVEAGAIYELIAQREADEHRAEILRRMAAAESGHRARIERRLTELGVPIPDPATVRPSLWMRLQARIAPVDRRSLACSTRWSSPGLRQLARSGQSAQSADAATYWFWLGRPR